jgi:hypothetical protein
MQGLSPFSISRITHAGTCQRARSWRRRLGRRFLRFGLRPVGLDLKTAQDTFGWCFAQLCRWWLDVHRRRLHLLRREASRGAGSRSSMLFSRAPAFNRTCRGRRSGSWPLALLPHGWIVLLLVLESVTLHVLHKLIYALVTGGGDWTASTLVVPASSQMEMIHSSHDESRPESCPGRNNGP